MLFTERRSHAEGRQAALHKIRDWFYSHTQSVPLCGIHCVH